MSHDEQKHPGVGVKLDGDDQRKLSDQIPSVGAPKPMIVPDTGVAPILTPDSNGSLPRRKSKFSSKRRRLNLISRGHSVPKFEGPFNDDAFCISKDRRRAAIADGTGSGSYSDLLAQILVESFVDDSSIGDELVGHDWKRKEWVFDKWCRRSANKWAGKVPWDTLGGIARRVATGTGAGSTFVGLWFVGGRGSRSLRWRAVAWGDSCLFHFRNNQLNVWFPLKKDHVFSSVTPAVTVRSREGTLFLPSCGFKKAEGLFLSGDSILITTDALAGWVLKELNSGGDPLKQIRSFKTEDAFRAFVYGERIKGGLVNDDTTFCLFHKKSV